jgi:hypothetical protein
MAASNKTVEEVLDIIYKYVPDLGVQNILLYNLGQVKGNRSFKETMRRLGELHVERANK